MPTVDETLENRMTPALRRALHDVLFAFEEQDVKTQTENAAILDRVARAAWREFRAACAEINSR